MDTDAILNRYLMLVKPATLNSVVLVIFKNIAYLVERNCVLSIDLYFREHVKCNSVF